MGDPGRAIGDWEILEVLGQGGMGVVYSARRRGSGERGALKTLGAPRHDLLVALRREIHALARIDHPGIVRILDEGVEGGIPWYAMELVEGVPLREWCALEAIDPGFFEPWWERGAISDSTTAVVTRNSAPPDLGMEEGEEPVPERPRGEAGGGILERILEVVLRLCEPLAFLHGEGIVHCDLKPENVIVRDDGQPVLVDFGVTTFWSGRANRERLFVEPGDVVAGTPLYMSPEQAAGDPLDARSDLYALGCLIQELVTGRPPFVKGSPTRILRRQIEDPPPSPSRFVTGVPAGLEELLAALLAKSPKERCGHALDVASAIARLLGRPLPEPAGPRRARSYLYRPELTGRDEIVASLDRRLDELMGGRGGVALFAGESGAGKTRLANEIGRLADRKGARVLAGECLRLGTGGSGAGSAAGPLAPLHDLFEAVGDRCREGGEEEVDWLLGGDLRILARFDPSFGSLPGAERCPEPDDLPADAGRRRLWGAIGRTLGRFAVDRPILLVLDDLQWADDLLLGLLDHLAAPELSPPGVLLLGTFRSDEAPEPLRRLARRGGVLRLEVGKLPPGALVGMAADMLALPEAPAGLARFLAERSGGNPFFVAEYMRSAIGEGIVWRDGTGRWRAPGEDESAYARVGLPDSIHELISRRLDRLGAGERRLAELAAVIGRELPADLLVLAAWPEGVPASDRATWDDLMSRTTELVAGQVLEPAAEGRLRFVHEKIREIAFESTEPAVRRVLHRRAADALEGLPEEERGDRLGEIAWHRQEAGETVRARECWLVAARRAAANFALGEAERGYRGHIALAPAPDRERVAARNELAREVFLVLGRTHEAIASHRLALDEARAIGDSFGEGSSLQGLSTCHRTLGEIDEAIRWGEQSLSVFRRLGDGAAVGMSLTILGAAHAAAGRLARAESLFEQALARHREGGNRKLEAITLSNLGEIERSSGRFPRAHELQRAALGIHREIGNRRSEGICLDNVAAILAEEEKLDEGRRTVEEALAVLRSVGDRRFEAMALATRADLLRRLGSVDAAREDFREAVRLLDEVDDRATAILVRCRGGALERLSTRRFDRLLPLARIVEEGIDHFRRLGNDLLLGELLVEAGHLALASGRSSAAALAEAKGAAARAGAEPASLLGRRIARLERAEESFAAGCPLFRGERIEELPAGLRRALAEREPPSGGPSDSGLPG
jgi:serine/threonine protein kinase/tetratricopeptide (TPR) repeat protein